MELLLRGAAGSGTGLQLPAAARAVAQAAEQKHAQSAEVISSDFPGRIGAGTRLAALHKDVPMDSVWVLLSSDT